VHGGGDADDVDVVDDVNDVNGSPAPAPSKTVAVWTVAVVAVADPAFALVGIVSRESSLAPELLLSLQHRATTLRALIRLLVDTSVFSFGAEEEENDDDEVDTKPEAEVEATVKKDDEEEEEEDEDEEVVWRW